MEYDPEAGLWIKFGRVRRAMVLRKTGAGKCKFQARGRACSVYAARPQTCRTFPYSVDFGPAGAVSEIRLNKVLDCNAEKRREIDVDALAADARKENREDKEYYRLVKRWNGSEGESGGCTADFLRFIGF
jgi:Fe-S-cluster containining protein